MAVKKGPQKWRPKVDPKSLGAIIRIGREIRCLPYAGFFFIVSEAVSSCDLVPLQEMLIYSVQSERRDTILHAKCTCYAWMMHPMHIKAYSPIN